MPRQETPFNPLDKVVLAENVAAHLVARPLGPLPPGETFIGAGIYAIYYGGGAPLYAPISGGDVPIYVGKAVPRGGRVGGFDLSANVGQVLFSRVSEHARSVDEATNLDSGDFRCRYLVVDDIWIPLAEQLLISRHRPLWNHVVGGFGNHDPGSTRYGQARPLWDELHPGRYWASRMQSAELSVAEIEALVQVHLAAHAPAVVAPSPDGEPTAEIVTGHSEILDAIEHQDGGDDDVRLHDKSER